MATVLNVKDHGVVADGETLVTREVQAVIDEVAKEGGVVVFPAGQYVLSTVYLRSNVHIQLEEGAELLGTLEVYEYNWNETIPFKLYQDSSHSYFHCSMFVGIGCENISITGPGKIDMRSVWEPANTRDNTYRGAKTVTLLECKNVELSGFSVYHATDLAIYFTCCENVDIYGLTMKVYIDGISPDNSKNVKIHDCRIEAGDDAIVLKSSYNTNRLDFCKDIYIWDCYITSRCNGLKLGTESNGGFINIHAENLVMENIRISGIALETVDGALIENVTVKNVQMKNVSSPIFVHVGRRMRGPDYLTLGQIRNITLENITATGPYVPYDIIPCYYWKWQEGDWRQYPWYYDGVTDIKEPAEENKDGALWQVTSNICGLVESPIENVTLRNIHLEVDGGVEEFSADVPDGAKGYPEVHIYGRILPAKGLFLRHINGLVMDNVTVSALRPDKREDFVLVNINDFKEN